MSTASNKCINKKKTVIVLLLMLAFSGNRSIHGQTSQYIRETHNFGIHGNLYPFVDLYWIATPQMRFGGYYLDNYTFYIAGRGLNQMVGYERLLYGQYFFGNSFYLKGGVGQRSIKAGEFVIDRTTEERYECHIFGEAKIASLSIGNQWTIGYFTLGGQWYGRATPLNRPKIDHDCANYLPTGEIDETEEEMKKYGFSSYYWLPLLFLGFQF